MNIETRFDLGQTVYRIGRGQEEIVKLPCRFCRGQRQLPVTSVNGESVVHVPCPSCGGVGSVAVARIILFALIGSGRIGSVEARRFLPELAPRGSTFYQDEERYMLDSTGVGSGSVYRNVDFYASETEARDECDARNEEIAAGRSAHWKPDRRAYEAALLFLEHKDVYEHTEEHVALARRLITAYEYEPEDGS